MILKNRLKILKGSNYLFFNNISNMIKVDTTTLHLEVQLHPIQKL